MNKTKIILIITIIFAILSLVGCSEKLSNQETAKVFVRKALTVPYDDIREIVKSEDLELDSASSSDLNDIKHIKGLNKAVESFCGDYISKDEMSDGSSVFFNQVIMQHIMASVNDFTFTVKDLEITKYDNKKYSYTADILANNFVKDELTLHGTIQFDDNNKINFMTIKY